MENYHVPVMLQESMEGLAIKPDGTYVDLTFGGGGHSKAILERLSPKGRLFSFDQDRDVLPNVPDDPRLTFVQSNFRYLGNFLRFYQTGPVDGILADLGVSSHHFDEMQRGFSFRFDGPLDMRMNQRSALTAWKVVNEYSEEALADVLYYYGEVEQSRRFAKAIVNARAERTIDSIYAFCEVLRPQLPKEEKKELARIFQALRIEVNDEMGALKQMLLATAPALASGGRLCVITYHSLEDRLVKNYMKAGNFTGKVEQDFYGNRLSSLKPVGKVTTATQQEVEDNPRARSGKLRTAVKL